MICSVLGEYSKRLILTGIFVNKFHRHEKRMNCFLVDTLPLAARVFKMNEACITLYTSSLDTLLENIYTYNKHLVTVT